jgi:hypothetical protein
VSCGRQGRDPYPFSNQKWSAPSVISRSKTVKLARRLVTTRFTRRAYAHGIAATRHVPCVVLRRLLLSRHLLTESVQLRIATSSPLMPSAWFVQPISFKVSRSLWWLDGGWSMPSTSERLSSINLLISSDLLGMGQQPFKPYTTYGTDRSHARSERNCRAK